MSTPKVSNLMFDALIESVEKQIEETNDTAVKEMLKIQLESIKQTQEIATKNNLISSPRTDREFTSKDLQKVYDFVIQRAENLIANDNLISQCMHHLFNAEYKSTKGKERKQMFLRGTIRPYNDSGAKKASKRALIITSPLKLKELLSEIKMKEAEAEAEQPDEVNAEKAS